MFFFNRQIGEFYNQTTSYTDFLLQSEVQSMQQQQQQQQRQHTYPLLEPNVGGLINNGLLY